MSQAWHTIKVFISSTFRDMHAERDHLVRVVFPELKERCRKRHVQLVDVDLRWGVTEEQVLGGSALDICLDEIDSCRPYFIGLLGHRYGYVPPGHDHSITANEIYHGVLHNNLPRQLIDLRPFVAGILEGRTLFKEQVSCLVRCYQWNPEKRKYLLQPNITPEDQKILCSIFSAYSIYQRDRSFFFFRSESLTRELAGSNYKDFIEADDTLKRKLGKLKQEIIDATLPCIEYDNLETFGQRVLETLWERIDTEFPEKREEIERNWLKEEEELHELFMADRTRRFVGRTEILKGIHEFVEKDVDTRLLVITGESGCGKSALMARFTEQAIHSHPDWVILSHFVGASPSSTNLRQVLKRFCTQLNCTLGLHQEVPEEYKELVQLFPELLRRASEKQRILLVIDALNQLEKTDNAHTMRWLPQNLLQNVKVVVSTLTGEILDILKTRRIQPRFEELTGLTEPEIKKFVSSYMDEIHKEFPTPEIREAFYEKIKAGNPLYILVALEELRVFPLSVLVGTRVASLPGTIPELFDQVLERVEGDFNRPLVQDFMSLIACGRQGMTGEELQTLLKRHTVVVQTDTPPGKLPDMLFARLRRTFGAYLFERSGVIDFFHSQLKEAVGKRYLSEESNRVIVYKVIANYFEKRWAEPYLRALEELPHQLTKAKDWTELERVLSNLQFIESNCAAGFTHHLVDEYKSALNALVSTDQQSESKILSSFMEFFIAEAHILHKYPQLTFQQAHNWPSDPILVINENQHSGIEASSWLRWLNKPKSRQSNMTILQTSSRVLCGSVSPDETLLVVGREDGVVCVFELRSGKLLHEIVIGLGAITTCLFDRVSNYVFFGSIDGSLSIVDPQNGTICEKRILHTATVTCIALNSSRNEILTVSEDGRALLSTFQDITLKNVIEICSESCPILFGIFLNNGDISCIGTAEGRLRMFARKTHWREFYSDWVHFKPLGFGASTDRGRILWAIDYGGRWRCLSITNNQSVTVIATGDLKNEVSYISQPAGQQACLIGCRNGQIIEISLMEDTTYLTCRSDSITYLASLSGGEEFLVVENSGMIARCPRKPFLGCVNTPHRLINQIIWIDNGRSLCTVSKTDTQKEDLLLLDENKMEFEMAIFDMRQMQFLKIREFSACYDRESIVFHHQLGYLLLPFQKYDSSGIDVIDVHHLNTRIQLKSDSRVRYIAVSHSTNFCCTLEEEGRLGVWNLLDFRLLWGKDLNISSDDIKAFWIDTALRVYVKTTFGDHIFEVLSGREVNAINLTHPHELSHVNTKSFQIKGKTTIQLSESSGKHNIFSSERGGIVWFNTVTPDQLIVLTEDGTLHHIDSEGQEISKIHDHKCTPIVFGKRLISVSTDDWLRIWDLMQCKFIMLCPILQGISVVALNPDMTTIGIGLRNGQLRLYQITEEKVNYG